MTDTQRPTVPPDPGAVDPPQPMPRRESLMEAAERVGLHLPSRRHGWWTWPISTASALALAAVVVGALLPSAWFVERPNLRLGVDQPAPFALTPAAAEPLHERVRFGDLEGLAEQYPPRGDIYFVTVMEREQTLLSWLVGGDDPAIVFLTAEEKHGRLTPSQGQALNLASMRTSEQVAQYVALKRVGYEVSVVLGDVLIEDMVCLEANAEGTECARWSPSDAVLDPGDKIVEVDGEEIATVEDLSRILDGRQPGDVVPMRIERPEQGELEVEVELTSSPDDPDRTIVGFYPFDTSTVELPFEVAIDTNLVGGPSAGLAFTLTLIDELTPGELTGGGRIAVTGEIALDGTVGNIGGLRQKVSAVAQAGIDVFLVPAGQADEAIAAARDVVGDDVRIIPVATVDEALAALEQLGGDPVP